MKKPARNRRAVVTAMRFKSSSVLQPKSCGFVFDGDCPLERGTGQGGPVLPRPGSMADCIDIPEAAREMDFSGFALSARLQNILGWKGCRALGDLHGVRLSELA